MTGRMFDGAVARGSALISGDARMFERAVAEGNSSFFSGELKEDARLSGNAVVNRSDNGLSPLIGRKSNVYGSVCGWFVVNDNIFEGGYVHSGEWKTGGIGKTAEIRASGGIPERKE